MNDDELLSPSEMAEVCDVTVDTLRYYEREGLLTSVRRTRGNQRRYSRDDVAWVKVLRCLRVTAMPVRDLQRFAELVRQGDAGAPGRLALLRDHREEVVRQRAALDDALTVIDGKIAAYARLVDGHPTAHVDDGAAMPTLGGQGARR
jgi:DNA-binding transcriptional MerR regulator